MMDDFDFSPKLTRAPVQNNDENPSYIEMLNPEQKRAALITDGPLLVLAGAGSGKTRMLTSRMAYLMERKGAHPSSILAVTFTNKAAGEMRERVEKALLKVGHGRLGNPDIGTFHSICLKILRNESRVLGFTQPFVIYDDTDQLNLVKNVCNRLNLDDKNFNPKNMQHAINRMKCDAVEAKDMNPEPHQVFERELKRVYEEYQRELFANQALDFGEMICLTYRLLRDNQLVRDKYQKRYEYLLVDEYQDTNRAQYLFLKMLAAKEQGGSGNICVVGDEDQSIYKWRGADIRNILDFDHDYPGAQIVKLEQNYRSTKTIITAADGVIRNNKSRKPKTLWTENPQGDLIERIQCADERMEAEYVVSETKRLAADDGYAYSDFSIFYRTNAQSRSFEDILRRERIPYQIVGGLRFYDRKEIKDVMAYFKSLSNMSDSISLKRIINVPARGIGKTTLEKLDSLYFQELRTNEKASLWDEIVKVAKDSSLISPAVSKKLSVFVELMESLRSVLENKTLSEIYHEFLDRTQYVLELKQEGTEESLARIENLEEFDSVLTEFVEDIQEERGKITGREMLDLFLEQSTLNTDAAEMTEYNASAVKMMTLHSSKGLEFPVVFMVGMEDGLFPSVRPWEDVDEEELEEERRLCYVGMTRAMRKLHMLSAAVRRQWGQVHMQEPSRFFAEIPDEFVNFKDLAHGNQSNFLRQGSARTLNEWKSKPSYPSSGGATPTSGRSGLGSAATRSESSSGLKGSFIDHPVYGGGKIVLEEGSGDDLKLTVDFGKNGHRKFLYKYIAGYLK